MNQILSVAMETKNKKVREPASVSSILKFFAIGLIVFGIFMIGTGSYALYKNSETTKNAIPTKPQISIENKSDTSILLKINHDKAIKEIVYNWTNEDQQKIDGNGKKTIEKEIEIPSGNNTLYIVATDVNGQSISYQKQYQLEGSININIETTENSKVKLSIESEKEISYITYRWDEEEEKKIEINDKKSEQEVEVMMGTHTITVVAVDEDNNTKTETKKIIGTTKPKISASLDGENYLIKITCDEILSKIEYTTDDGTETKEINEKEYELRIPLKHGSENIVNLSVFIENKVAAEQKLKCKLE